MTNPASPSHLRVAIAQLNFLVGDVQGNAKKILHAMVTARDELGANVILFPELALTGYPPEDLLLRPDFCQMALNALNDIATQVQGIDVVVGAPWLEEGGLYNAAVVLRDGKILDVYYKQHLPNYSVFDEKRYFTAGDRSCIIDMQGTAVAITVCEDLWHPGPMVQAYEAGGCVMLNLNASPFHINKGAEREEILRQRLREGPMPIVYANLIGGQDELVFDGESFVMDCNGVVVARAPAYEEGIFPVDILVDRQCTPLPAPITERLPLEVSVYRALVLAVRDYIKKNAFNGVVIGLSGGIDSALTLAIAVDAIGAKNVEAVMLPSRYTLAMSQEDAQAQAQALGVEYQTISIEPAFQAFLHSLQAEFAGKSADITEENIQARCRGVILMAISNKKRKMVLTTGNKSEMAVGYATLYGDMAGGFAPIKDVPKTLVYRLAAYRNSLSQVIPTRVFERPPTAELAPNQKDEDSLPPYPLLDAILDLYIEQDKCRDDIIAAGYDEVTVSRVIEMVNRNEYKRRQAPPGVRISRRAFGRDRRYPIVSGYR